MSFVMRLGPSPGHFFKVSAGGFPRSKEVIAVAASHIVSLLRTLILKVSRPNQVLLLVSCWLLLGEAICAHDVITTKITWSREISRIFQRRCMSCHHPNGQLFGLSTYDQVRPWAEAIKEEVLERRMPPWGAVKGFGEFLNDEGLMQEEIETIARWAEGGAPLGDTRLLPDKLDSIPRPQALPKTAGALRVKGTLIVSRDVVIAAIRPDVLPEGASLRLTAELPDGSVEPLIWLYKYAPRFARTYYFKVPMHFRAGTSIRMYPKIGQIALLLEKH